MYSKNKKIKLDKNDKYRNKVDMQSCHQGYRKKP